LWKIAVGWAKLSSTIMKYKTLFRIMCKAIGVYFFVSGCSGALMNISGLIVMFFVSPAAVGPYRSLYSIPSGIGSLVDFAVGYYLFFHGQTVANWAVPGNRPYCPECGYDLSGSVSGMCPECGTQSAVPRPD
jgi:hypothetical protein